MFTNKKLLNGLSVIMLFGLPTVSFSMEIEKRSIPHHGRSISDYGTIGWTGHTPAPFQQKQSSAQKHSPKVLKLYSDSYKLDEKRGLASFELHNKKNIDEPRISHAKDKVSFTFESKKSNESSAENPRKKKRDSMGIEVKKDRVEFKLNNGDSLDTLKREEQQTNNSKKRKNVNGASSHFLSRDLNNCSSSMKNRKFFYK